MATDDYTAKALSDGIEREDAEDDENYREPEGMSFEDSMALKYPLIDQEYPFHE